MLLLLRQMLLLLLLLLLQMYGNGSMARESERAFCQISWRGNQFAAIRGARGTTLRFPT